MLKYKTGLNLSPNPPRLRFGAYMNAALLPPTPAVFGHYTVIPAKNWLMLENDSIADCTIAGAMHVSMLWNEANNRSVHFTNLDAVDDYSDACGYVTGQPATDNGGDMVTVAKYWQSIGMRDCTAARHKIAAYLQIDATNLDHIDAAAYLFDAVGLGVTLPASAEKQFDAGQPWHAYPNDTATDYHYVPYVGRDRVNRQVVTWGALQAVEEPWLIANLKEVVAIISMDDMANQKSPDGFSYADLQSDLAAL